MTKASGASGDMNDPTSSDSKEATASKKVAKPACEVRHYGVRHHGPESAHRLCQALSQWQPDVVLLEGPTDCTDLLAYLASAATRPPIALLAYAADDPERHVYYPLAEYSPEYQAARWALAHGADLAFIDIPVACTLHAPEADATTDASPEPEHKTETNADTPLDSKINNALPDNASENTEEEIEPDLNTTQTAQTALTERVRAWLTFTQEPIGALAATAGYRDGEAWWNDVLEQRAERHTPVTVENEKGEKENVDDGTMAEVIFASLATAMTALRDREDAELAAIAEALHTVALDADVPASAIKPSVNTTPKLTPELADAWHTAVARHRHNQLREAHMREQTRAWVKTAQNAHSDRGARVAVVCGAWHVPALQSNLSVKHDRDILKTLPKKRPASQLKRTWVPWTSSRLTHASGYGAGVSAPMWYAHLWQHRTHPHPMTAWLTHTARALREAGHAVSTASVIEAVRLAGTLATVRGKPSAGFGEAVDAIVSCLCFGQTLPWQMLEAKLLLGNEVGQIPDDVPLAPLLEDLTRQQKRTKLKPEALARELSLDLRSASGNARSRLLHQLAVLDVPWGTRTDSGRSRGTFRENWQLQWQPEYAVRLIENLVYGTTIEQAANARLSETLRATAPVDTLAELVLDALTAGLDDAVAVGLARLATQAVHTQAPLAVLRALVPLAHISRYGTARAMDVSQLTELLGQLTTQAAIALPLACRGLDAAEANAYRQAVSDAHHALLLAAPDLPRTAIAQTTNVQTGDAQTSHAQTSHAQTSHAQTGNDETEHPSDPDALALWWEALAEVATLNVAHPAGQPSQTSGGDASHAGVLVGLANRLLYQGERLDAATLRLRLAKALSPAVPALLAAGVFEGFFVGSADQLLYDDALLATLKAWVMSLESEVFVSHLPLFKRVFADLDATERARLLHQVLGHHRTQGLSHALRDDPHAATQWSAHLAALAARLPWQTNVIDGEVNIANPI